MRISVKRARRSPALYAESARRTIELTAGALILVCAALCLVACAPPLQGQANGPVVTLAPGQITPIPTALPNLTGPDSFPPGINPLTGQPADPAALARRPLIVQISNAPPMVRPQAGLAAADVLFEYEVEGGLTRFSAVYLSQLPERAGSIRSARLIDDHLIPMFSAAFAYSGASEGVTAVLNNAEYAARTFSNMQLDGPYFWRDLSIEPPHNLFANPAALVRDFPAQTAGPVDLSGWAFRAEPPPDPLGPAAGATIPYLSTTAAWDYDAASGLYVRSSDGLPHADAATGAPLTAANVLILYAPHALSDIVESEWQGQPVYGLDIDLAAGGEALLLRDGQAYAARWTRPARDDLLRLFTPAGGILPFKPGTTFVQVVAFGNPGAVTLR
jgi:hypothetical protein